MSNTIQYFARTLHGLEKLSWEDLAAHLASGPPSYSHRTFQFSSAAAPSDFLELRGIEDIFVLAGKITGLTHERSSLKTIEDQVRLLPFTAALQICKSVRSFAPRERFSVTASFVGSRNYNRWELAEAVAKGLERKQSWEYVDTRSTPFPPHDIHVRLVIEEDYALVGLRLGTTPLHKRPYKQVHTEASLNPVLAYHLVRLANLHAGETLLDPMCGAGTIPIEAACCEPEAIVLGLDLNPEAIQATQENAALAGTAIAAQVGDATNTQLETGSINAIVSDLPWGGQTELKGGSLNDLTAEFSRLLSPDGRLIILTEHPEDVQNALELRNFRVQIPYTISLHGKHPRVLLSKKP
ncbi:MAG: RNA methyltransferase [Deltaproteobacteria bacterium]|nr:RNA methyltransferase [Deltaproteobacteria bacterium]